MQDTTKRLRHVAFLILIIVSLAGCSWNKPNNERVAKLLPDADAVFFETASSLREIAWNQLSEQSKKTVIGDWKEAKVTSVRWDDVPIKETESIPKSVYKITFNTKQDELLGPIGIYFDPAAKTIIGHDARK